MVQSSRMGDVHSQVGHGHGWKWQTLCVIPKIRLHNSERKRTYNKCVQYCDIKDKTKKIRQDKFDRF